jgi:KEOPS complex subunit Cgi121
MFKLKGPFGERFASVVGGRVKVKNVDRLLEKLAEIDDKTGSTSQIFDASRIAGVEHLVHAARLALTSRAAGKSLASSLNIELVCWTAGLRQIEQALERVGLQENTDAVAILTVGADKEGVERTQEEILEYLGIERDDTAVEMKPGKTSSLVKTFSISRREREVTDVQKIILERVALLALQR